MSRSPYIPEEWAQVGAGVGDMSVSGDAARESGIFASEMFIKTLAFCSVLEQPVTCA